MTAASAVVPQDPFERWAALQAWSTDTTNRLDEETDLAFWERVADDYDRGALATRPSTNCPGLSVSAVR